MQRLYRRLLLHHLPLFALSIVSVTLFALARPIANLVARLSFATAYPALLLIAATLIIGPWTVLRGKRMALSSDWRRDVGIWAGILSLAHTALGQNVHLRGRPWLYYVYDPLRGRHAFPMRHDLFGAANYTGMASTLVIAALLATSADCALRRLGARGWKRLQYWNYAAFLLATLHAFLYQATEKNHRLLMALAALILTAVAGFQLSGYRRRSKPEFR